MKNFKQAAAIAAALTAFASTSPAFAADTAPASPTGHYEWRGQSSFGPRAPLRAPIRVWVGDGGATVPNCDSAMMHGSATQATDCMAMSTKRMPAVQG